MKPERSIPRVSSKNASHLSLLAGREAGAGRAPHLSSHIIVVNDQPCQLRYISQVLKSAGHSVVSYTRAKLALEDLKQRLPADLIITDLNMPEMSGWAFCEALRSPIYHAHNDTPILVISATFSGLENERFCQELGVNDFLSLPYTMEQLRRKTQDVLEGRRPKPRLTALLWGFGLRSAQEEAFFDFGYDVIACETYEEAARAKLTRTIQLAVASNSVDESKASDFFEFKDPIVARLWVQPRISQQFASLLSQQGVDFVGFAQPQHVVAVCEKARQYDTLTRARDLLEERTNQLISSESTYRTLFQSIPDLVFLTDESGIVLNVNEAGCKMLGRTRKQTIGKHLTQFTVEEREQEIRDLLQETIQYGYVQYEAVFKTVNLDMTVEVHQRKFQREGATNILAIARDVTERHHYQEAVKLSELRYRILVENTYDWEFWIGPLGHFLFSSPACEKVTGCVPRDFESDIQVLLDMIHPQDRSNFQQNWPTEPHPDGKDFLFRLYRADGELRWINHVSLPVFDSNGNFIGSRGSHRDVTEKRKGEEERARLVSAVDQVTESIVITDVQGNISYANQAYLEVNGLSLLDVLGRPPQLISADDGPPLEEEIRARLRERRNWSGSYLKYNSKTTRTINVEVTVSLVRDAQGEPSHYIWVERDVTQERHLQDQLRHSQKLETVGRLAGGIAHDFNNLLGGILGHTALLKLHSDNSAEISQAVEIIERTARRAADLTQKLLGFARQGKNRNVALSLNHCILDCIELLSGTFDKKIQVVTDFCAGDPKIMGDPTQLEQILLNLSINSRDAMNEGGGLLTFRTRIVKAQGDLGLVQIEVTDDGQGIPPELQSRIFEPFFTTKETGKGTGMGLAMVYGIVSNHGGTIEVTSKAGVGTTFVITLPMVAIDLPKDHEVKSVPLIKGSGRILVVDDDSVLRDVASRLLKRLGYEVVTVCDGFEACEYYEEHYREIDLVILDMIMPRMAGAECFRKLKAFNPAIRAVLSTGYSLNETAQALMNEGMKGFVQKPYLFNQLSEAVSKALSCDE